MARMCATGEMMVPVKFILTYDTDHLIFDNLKDGKIRHLKTEDIKNILINYCISGLSFIGKHGKVKPQFYCTDNDVEMSKKFKVEELEVRNLDKERV
jgi:hypothetical protein